MTTITWPTNTADIIDDIRGAIGRNIAIYINVSGIPCTASGCLLDPVTNLSVNQFCQVCHGEYWLSAVSGVLVEAHVTWKGADIPVWMPGGQVPEGDCRIQIKYTVANVGYVEAAEYYIVDGKTLIQDDVTLRGVPEINRIIISLVQKE